MKFLKKLISRYEIPAEGGCKHAQKIAGRYGQVLTCPEDEEVVVYEDPQCKEIQRIVSKYGHTIVCPEQ